MSNNWPLPGTHWTWREGAKPCTVEFTQREDRVGGRVLVHFAYDSHPHCVGNLWLEDFLRDFDEDPEDAATSARLREVAPSQEQLMAWSEHSRIPEELRDLPEHRPW